MTQTQIDDALGFLINEAYYRAAVEWQEGIGHDAEWWDWWARCVETKQEARGFAQRMKRLHSDLSDLLEFLSMAPLYRCPLCDLSIGRGELFCTEHDPANSVEGVTSRSARVQAAGVALARLVREFQQEIQQVRGAA